MRSAESPASKGGFTLLEVMVALVITAIVLLGGRTIVEQVGASAEHIAGTAADVDREANGDRLLRALIARASLPEPEHEFMGAAVGTRFTSWCEVPAGWLERCRISLGILQARGSGVLALQIDGGAVVVVRHGFRAGHFLYLLDPAHGGKWVSEWNSSVTTPMAVGVVLDGDTAILRLGERG